MGRGSSEGGAVGGVGTARRREREASLCNAQLEVRYAGGTQQLDRMEKSFEVTFQLSELKI